MPSKLSYSIFFTLCLTLALGLTNFAWGTDTFASNAVSKYYGNYWRWSAPYGVGNIQAGSNNDFDKISVRFRAQHTGQVDSVRMYWMPGDNPSYADGTGGIMRCELQTDDGTANHLPSGTALASFQITVNRTGYNSANPIFGTLKNGDCFVRLYFDSPATIQAGQLYHIVLTNPDSDPLHNYWSVDFVWNPNPLSPKQPAYSDTDLQILVHDGPNPGYGKDPPNSWGNASHAPYATPIYTLYWTDGTVQGQPYLQLGYPLGLSGYPIYGTTNKVRQPFKVSSASKTVIAASINAYKSGSPPDLTITLQDGNGSTIAQGTIAASTFVANSSNPMWGKVTFSSPITLKVGSTYYVEVSAPGGDSSNCYHTWSSENGYKYGFTGDGFADGAQSGHYGQYMTNGTTWQTDSYDMMIFFELLNSQVNSNSKLNVFALSLLLN
jgi:hypothetical protein